MKPQTEIPMRGRRFAGPWTKSESRKAHPLTQNWPSCAPGTVPKCGGLHTLFPNWEVTHPTQLRFKVEASSFLAKPSQPPELPYSRSAGGGQLRQFCLWRPPGPTLALRWEGPDSFGQPLAFHFFSCHRSNSAAET